MSFFEVQEMLRMEEWTRSNRAVFCFTKMYDIGCRTSWLLFFEEGGLCGYEPEKLGWTLAGAL